MIIQFLNKIATKIEWDVFLILTITSLALASLGIFLVLKKMTMTVDAISHTVLLGIVLAFLITGNLNSPLLIIGAISTGLITVILIEILKKNAQISSDGAINIILTFLFSIAIIIINNYTRNVHIDTDAVFLGNVELINLKQIYKILPILIINLIYIFLFFKEIKIFIFDPCLCSLLGFSTIIINYLLMTLVSLTVVVCFDIVGSIMVISCMIGPAMTAILLTSNLLSGFLLSLWISLINTYLGYFSGILWDIPIASAIAIVNLIHFLLVLIFEKRKGIITTIIQNHKQKKNFLMLNLLIHLENHQNQPFKKQLTIIQEDLKWNNKIFKKCIEQAFKNNYIIYNKTNQITISPLGKNFIQSQQQDNNFLYFKIKKC
ncbi:MAG: metal ABC transporter permease [Pigeon pea little leaf phytoplasma]|uniref:Metal ABC transporter permease n=1 Tax=Candidatus Phytoplasma fabacearum TaxID=2982628 RepID=A0ABU8ZSR5_9MOLU|nr:metal ABC transporter permease ['Bituminaria bituminosa' little leaf phytoplasma]MDV3148741.1 metal ABC transporter permease [Pigeon pea little leaf phytoplasma]MDO7983727.1 metal ABC transporter permease ['Bituminaria bituminosa' little leaf phytoplasma]MDO8024062.1 metal ABC transporter permease ['Bituminaria bituminosa' little leaf phytoplasma]MDO8030750.1 metal ABC transporter permease ['Bituminaria bituminosa' little leaf phytoplasma]MDV3154222.1 metal ABC transporter permease [Pigeon 